MDEREKRAKSDTDGIRAGDCYSAFVAALQGTEHTRAARFNIFLLTNSILVFAWINLFTAEHPGGEPWHHRVMGLLCVLGVFGGLVGCVTGCMVRKYIDTYHKLLYCLEGCVQGGVPRLYRDGISKIHAEYKCGKSRYLKRLGSYNWQFKWVPIVFVGLYVALGVITLRTHGSNGVASRDFRGRETVNVVHQGEETAEQKDDAKLEKVAR